MTKMTQEILLFGKQRRQQMAAYRGQVNTWVRAGQVSTVLLQYESCHVVSPFSLTRLAHRMQCYVSLTTWRQH